MFAGCLAVLDNVQVFEAGGGIEDHDLITGLNPAVPGQPAQQPSAQLVAGGAGLSPVATPPPQPGSVAIPPAPPGADPRAVQRMNEYTAQKIVQGYTPHGPPGADSLSRNASRNYQVTLNAGDCYTLAAFGGAGVRDLDIYLTSPTGQQLARDIATDSRPIVNTCVQQSGAYRVRILMYAGAGPFTYQIYRNPGAAAQATGLAGVDPTVRRLMDQFGGRMAARGFRPLPGVSGSGTLGRGQRQEFTVTIPTAGSCYLFAGFAGTGMRDLDIYLRDANGAQLRRDIAVDPVADVKQFITTPGPYRMQLHAYSGSGAFAYQVFQLPNQPCP